MCFQYISLQQPPVWWAVFSAVHLLSMPVLWPSFGFHHAAFIHTFIQTVLSHSQSGVSVVKYCWSKRRKKTGGKRICSRFKNNISINLKRSRSHHESFLTLMLLYVTVNKNLHTPPALQPCFGKNLADTRQTKDGCCWKSKTDLVKHLWGLSGKCFMLQTSFCWRRGGG